MNNSKLAIDYVPLTLEVKADNTEHFQEREATLLKIIDALQGISSTKEWGSLKELVFDPILPTLEKSISAEARKESPDTLKLNRLAGQLKWAERYSDLSKLEQVFRVELSSVRKQLYGKTQEDS